MKGIMAIIFVFWASVIASLIWLAHCPPLIVLFVCFYAAISLAFMSDLCRANVRQNNV